MKNNFVTFIIITCSIISFPSCNREEGNDMIGMAYATSHEKGYIHIGQQLNDPYDIGFMTLAFKQMKAEGYTFPFDKLSPNAKYIRVLVSTSDDLDTIEADTTLLWFDFPLDYDIPEGGTSFHDNSLPDSVMWKYGVVPLEYEAPSTVKSELLHELFFPELHPDYAEHEKLFYDLEARSEELCDNPVSDQSSLTPISQTDGLISRLKWEPKASIKAWDDVMNEYIPVQGVKVAAQHYTRIRSCCTNADGNCTLPKDFLKGHRVKYWISWERNFWSIRDGYVCQAYYNGPKKKGAWELKISGGKSLMYATIHRAAIKAFYGDFAGLQRPYSKYGLKISYLHKNNGLTTGRTRCNFDDYPFLPNISIWGLDNLGERARTDLLFGTAIHEFTHQSHYKFLGPGAYDTCNKFIRESWCRCVEWYITNSYYTNELGAANYHYDIDAQDWTRHTLSNGKHWPYTPALIDLIDTTNQRNSNNNYCIDHISGYTPSEIQDLLLPYSKDLYSLHKTLLCNLLHGTTQEDADELLLINYDSLGF